MRLKIVVVVDLLNGDLGICLVALGICFWKKWQAINTWLFNRFS